MDNTGKIRLHLPNQNAINEENELTIKTKLYRYGNALNSIRLELNLNQTEFAIKCGLSKSFMSEILNGKKIPDLGTIEKICSRLHINVDAFMFKAFNEENIEDDNKRKFISDLKPLLANLALSLYETEPDDFEIITNQNRSVKT